VKYDKMMSHIDCTATLAKMVGLTPPEHDAWAEGSGKHAVAGKYSVQDNGGIGAVPPKAGQRK
jgi:hypothetical protein